MGIVSSSLIISLILYIVLNYIKKYNIKSYDEYINNLFKRNKFLSYLNENIITIFLLFTFYIMELGFINLLFQQYGISKYIGMLIITILVYFVLIGNVKNVIKVNVFLVPILIISMLYISITGIIKFSNNEITLLTNVDNMFIIDAICRYGGFICKGILWFGCFYLHCRRRLPRLLFRRRSIRISSDGVRA